LLPGRRDQTRQEGQILRDATGLRVFEPLVQACLWLVPDEPGVADVIAEQRELLARLRAVIEAKDEELAALRTLLAAVRGS
jgi:hypothetical protein